MQLRRLNGQDDTFDQALTALMNIDAVRDETLTAQVQAIVDDVRLRGDAALLEYTTRFDRRTATAVSELEVPLSACAKAFSELPTDIRDALELAAARIREYHQHQCAESWDYTDALGNRLGQKVTPLDRVGIYVPGGKASYPSSVLMNAIPARVAGVTEIIMVVPAPEGHLNPMVLAAAHLAQVTRVFTIGGAQAIAALAYGTDSVPAVDKIVGPGNAYVATAKRLVFGQVGLDMIAGPSEIVVVCDGKTNPEWIVMDLFAQAEHDEQAQSILISPDAAFLTRVMEAIERLLPAQPRAAIIRQSLEQRGAFIEVADLDAAAALCNRMAPEHLELSVDDPDALLAQIRHAGAVFMGRYTAEVMGDYCAGPNHVLPTSGTARFSSPLGVYDFQKRTSVIRCSESGAQSLAKAAKVLAEGESLPAHAASAACRIRS
ncbi:MAG TPA: histidinol dehydrogenase [Pseudomonadales bacterium]